MRLFRGIRWAACLALVCLPGSLRAQTQTVTNGAVGGVAITTEGFLHYRQIGALPAPGLDTRNRRADQLYVSLPRALAEWRAAKDAGREPGAEIRYLKGLSRIENVFIYPEAHDIVLAGPSEPYKPDNALEPVGVISGRPLVQMEDLIVALRAVSRGDGGGERSGEISLPGGRDFFGCSLERPGNFQDAWSATLAKYGGGPRATLVAEMKKALGPQEVKLYGVPGDSRVALAMVAADYRLKRICMGLETVTGIGNALGSENAAPRIWFEPAYEPLLMSADGSAYELRGPRLKVLVGMQGFSAIGATDVQRRFGENFSKNMGTVVERVPVIADLQNIADCFMVAALVRQDRLLEKTGLDWSWLMGAEAGRYKTASLTVPRTAETVVHINGNVIAQGGVAMGFGHFARVERRRGGGATFRVAAARPEEMWYLTKAP